MIGGCGTTPPTQFYTLTALSSASEAPESVDINQLGPSVAVSRVKLPQYLDRPHIVTRTSRNTLELAEFNHWLGSLEENVTAVLAENLSLLIPTNRVTTLPKRVATAIDYKVLVDVIHFERNADGLVTLNVRWHILEGNGTSVTDSDSSRFVETVGAESYEEIVAAMNRALDELSREIASEIADLWKNKRRSKE
jgi:uncharacterized lipoprotein YmbA